MIEHLSDINDFIDVARKRLTKEGVLMIFCPNGSPEYRKREPELFHINWGFIHPNYLHPNFVINAFKDNPYLILTGDWDFDEKNILNWDRRSQIVHEKRDGKELLFIVYPNIKN